MKAHLRFSKKFLPFERAALSAVHALLPAQQAELLASQLASINKIQRLLEWHEVQFYSMHWFKVRWPEATLFARRGEFELAQVTFGNAASSQLAVHCVGGHVFSLESDRSMKQLGQQSSVEAIRASLSIDVSHLERPGT